MSDSDASRPAGAPTFAARQRWEYLILEGALDGTTRVSFEDDLNRIGADGWEVCGFETHRTLAALQRRVIFKRPTLVASLPALTDRE